jgi:hypothetical protein
MKKIDILIIINLVVIIIFILFTKFVRSKELSEQMAPLIIIFTPLSALILSKFKIIKL